MAILSENDSLLLMIDVQEKLLNAAANREIIANKAEIILKAAKILDIPVIITEQYPNGLGHTAENLLNISDKFTIFEKLSFSALDEENIFDALKAYNKNQIVVFGIETHICVSQTVNALNELGYDVNVISDCCGSRNIQEHTIGLDRIKEDGAHILTTEMAIFEWLRTSRHPKFKELQSLVK